MSKYNDYLMDYEPIYNDSTEISMYDTPEEKERKREIVRRENERSRKAMQQIYKPTKKYYSRDSSEHRKELNKTISHIGSVISDNGYRYNRKENKFQRGSKNIKVVMLKSDIKTNISKDKKTLFVNKKDVRRYELLKKYILDSI